MNTTAMTCCGREFASVNSRIAHQSHHPGSRQWPTLEEWFWRRVDTSGDCWIWTGHVNNRGYGTIPVEGRMEYAHRVSWRLEHGPIPDGMGVLHRCDNPPCVRPGHLFLGGQKINGEDMAAKFRSTFGERNPASRLTIADVLSIHDSTENYRVVAARYGVHRNTVLKIRAGRRWATALEALKSDRAARMSRRGDCE